MCATDADARFDARLEHLHQPASYPLGPEMVETRETHMSWVFLAGGLAYKLKKPIRSDLYDWRTAERRRRDCEREVALNRRLASSVYHGVVPLTLSPAGTLQLEGDDEPVDWLVKMRRLPDTLMLDWLIEHQCIAPDQIRPAIRMLCRLYRKSTSTGISGPGYCAHLAQSLKQSFGELVRPQYGQPDKLVRRVHKSLLSYIEREAALLRRRADSGRVIDAHGDLRPEHICLTSPPVIIDCLQFSDRLRVLDTASEIAFLMLECERGLRGHLRRRATRSSSVILPRRSRLSACDDRRLAPG